MVDLLSEAVERPINMPNEDASNSRCTISAGNVITFRTESPNTIQAANSTIVSVVCVIANKAATWLAMANTLASR